MLGTKLGALSQCSAYRQRVVSHASASTSGHQQNGPAQRSAPGATSPASSLILPAGARLAPKVSPAPSSMLTNSGAWASGISTRMEAAAPATLAATATTSSATSSEMQQQHQQHATPAASQGPLIYLAGQRIHSLHEQGKEVVQSLGTWAETDLMRFLKPVDKCWQPSDFLPDPASPDFEDQLMELRKASANLPLDYLVVLVGDMVTEEALPSYMNMLNLLDGTKDETGAQDQPWARWTRHWTAEENRHGDLLNRYLYLSGRVDMRSIETTIQRLISSGLDPRLENNPYLCFVYTSFQERATKISHGNTARLATYYGDTALTKMCGLIAADESRHEAAYTNIVDQFLQRDPEGALLAFADMMHKGIVMPAHFVDDGVHSSANGPKSNLFHDYATVADNIGVYTTQDYADIVDHLVARWRISELQGLSGQAAAAQEFLMSHSKRIRRLADIQAERRLRDRKRGKNKSVSFSWVNGREVVLV